MSIPKENDENRWKSNKTLQEDELPRQYKTKKETSQVSKTNLHTGPVSLVAEKLCERNDLTFDTVSPTEKRSCTWHHGNAMTQPAPCPQMEYCARGRTRDADDKKLQDLAERRETKNCDGKADRRTCYLQNCPVNKKLKHEKLCKTDECPVVIKKKIIKETKKLEKRTKKNPLVILGEAVLNTFMDKESNKLSKNDRKCWKKKCNLETSDEQLQDFNNNCCHIKDKSNLEPKCKYLAQQEDSNSLLDCSKEATTSCGTLNYPISKKHEVTNEFMEKCNDSDDQSQLNDAIQSRLNSLRGCPNVPCKLKEKDEIYFDRCVPREIKEKCPQRFLSCYENHIAPERGEYKCEDNAKRMGVDVIERKGISAKGAPRANEMKGERKVMGAGKGLKIKGQESCVITPSCVRGSFNEERTICYSGNVNYPEDNLVERTRSDKNKRYIQTWLSETANNFCEKYNSKMDTYMVNDVGTRRDVIRNSHALPVLLNDKQFSESTGFRKRTRSDKSDIDIGTESPLKTVTDVDGRKNKISKNNDNSPAGQSFPTVINWTVDQAPFPKEIDSRTSNKFDAMELSKRNNGIENFENKLFYENYETALYPLSNFRSHENDKNCTEPMRGLEYSSKGDEKSSENSLKNLRQRSADNLIRKTLSKKVTISEDDVHSDYNRNSSHVLFANTLPIHLLEGTRRNYQNFPEDTNIVENDKVPRNKVTFVGANSIASACAMSLLLKDVTREIMFYDDQSVSRLLDDTIDIRRASSYTEQSNILCSNDPVDTATSRLVILIEENDNVNKNKINVVRKNIAKLNNYIRNLAEHSPEAVFLVAIEPVDLMSWVVWRMTQLPSNQVIGTGTNLDTVNLRNLLAKKVNLPINIIDAWIIGEHGENCVPVWSSVNMVDSKWSDLSGSCIAEKWSDILEAFVRVNADANTARGHLEWAVIMSIVDMCKTILQNKENIHSISTLVGGHYDVESEVFLSVPCKISARGVQNIIKLRLTKREKELFKHSATVCIKVLNDCQLNLPAGHVIEVPEEDEQVFSSFPLRK